MANHIGSKIHFSKEDYLKMKEYVVSFRYYIVHCIPEPERMKMKVCNHSSARKSILPRTPLTHV